MVRPFDLRDLALVKRLSERGVSLHAETALSDNLYPLRGALTGMLLGGDLTTLVAKPGNGETAGFLQLLAEPGDQHAHILYISPASVPAFPTPENSSLANPPTHDGYVWLSLLDQAVVEAGQRGIHSIVAEVDETGEALPWLRRAGFAVYTRQDIWMLTAREYRAAGAQPAAGLTRYRPSDEWDVQLLYANTVPRLVQLVEPTPQWARGERWVWRDGDELAAFVHMYHGPLATWLRFYVHPNADAEAEQIVAAVLNVQPPREGHPVYCCVRRYESWRPSILERFGFQSWGSQAVMVKHTVQNIARPMTEMASIFESQRIPASTPMVRQLNGCPSEADGRARAEKLKYWAMPPRFRKFWV
jgi:hypothetical protein